jgi:small subunit ribosomal protein S9
MTPSATSSRQYFYASGKRKTAIAKVKLFQGGTGKVSVNDKALKEYFAGIDQENAVSPLRLTGMKGIFDVEVYLQGGGKSSQSDAMRHGISRALTLASPDTRTELKRAGFLRRDARIKERKKPGLKRARRAPQWQKR